MFTTKIYHLPGIDDVCLYLQDEHGLDVNLVLFCIWIGAFRKISLSNKDVTALLDASSQWQSSVVQKIRRLRRWLKFYPDVEIKKLRNIVKSVELASEYLEQAELVSVFSKTESAKIQLTWTEGSSRENIFLYIRHVGADKNKCEAYVDTIISAAKSLYFANKYSSM